jgi:hypothetical protein
VSSTDPNQKLKEQVRLLKAENKRLRWQEAGYKDAIAEWQRQIRWLIERLQHIEQLLHVPEEELAGPEISQIRTEIH